MPFPSRPSLVLGCAFIGAVVLAVWAWRDAGSGQLDFTDAVRGPVDVRPVEEKPDKPAPLSGPGTWVERKKENPAMEAPVPPAPLPTSHSVASAGPATAPELTDAEIWAHYEPSREELAYRAYKVEQQANKELKNLLQVLDLDEAQQDRVFAALVRGSSFYHPSLIPQGAGGAPVGSSPTPGSPAVGDGAPTRPGTSPQSGDAPASPTADPVLAVLTPEQSSVYERYKSERDAFWAGVVEDVEQELNAAP
jgi:hypothetical protein